MSFENKFKELVKAAAENKAIDLAKRAGVPQSTLSMFLSGARSGMQLASVGKLLDAIGAELVMPNETEVMETPLRDYVFVPKVKAVAGAGASFEVDDTATGLYAFRRDFLNREHIHTTNLVMMLVRGDSMEPLIREGDTVLVDQTDTIPEDGKVYVLRIDDSLMVKRMEKIPSGWKVKSDNPERGCYDLRGEELEAMHVFGRVRWFGRVL